MPVPDFSPGEVLTAQAMDSIGMWLVKTVTIGSGVTNVPVTDAFSTDYDNYRIVINDMVMSAGGGGLRFVLGGTFPHSNYYWGSTLIQIPSGTVVGAFGNNAGFILIGTSTASNAFSNSFDVCNPFIAKRTSLNGFNSYSELGGMGNGNGIHNADTSFTGFTIYPASGTMTGGKIRVYGYRN